MVLFPAFLVNPSRTFSSINRFIDLNVPCSFWSSYHEYVYWGVQYDRCQIWFQETCSRLPQNAYNGPHKRQNHFLLARACREAQVKVRALTQQVNKLVAFGQATVPHGPLITVFFRVFTKSVLLSSASFEIGSSRIQNGHAPEVRVDNLEARKPLSWVPSINLVATCSRAAGLSSLKRCVTKAFWVQKSLSVVASFYVLVGLTSRIGYYSCSSKDWIPVHFPLRAPIYPPNVSACLIVHHYFPFAVSCGLRPPARIDALPGWPYLETSTLTILTECITIATQILLEVLAQ